MSKRIFIVGTSQGDLTLKVPGYDKLLPLFSTMQKEVEGLSEIDMMLTLSKKCIPLFWADERPLDKDDIIGSLQDLDLSLKDIVQISSAIFEKIKEQVQLINEAEDLQKKV